MKKLSIVVLSLIVGQAFVVVAIEPAPIPPGPFTADNKALGAWKHVTRGKVSPFGNDKTTIESKMISKSAVNGWFVESSIDNGPSVSKSMVTVEPDGKTVRVWLFAQNNVVTLTGHAGDGGTAPRLSGTDQYGNSAELTDKWTDDDHREGTFTVKSADGTVLIDVSTTLTRVGK